MVSYLLLWRFLWHHFSVFIRGGGRIEDVTLLLYLKDVEYGKRLLHFLIQKKNPWIHPEIVTAKSKMELRTVAASEEVMVLTDDPEIYEDEKDNVILLSGKQDRRLKKIFQYQKAEGIYKELLWQLKLEPERIQPPHGKDTDLQEGVFAVFSPDASGATALSVLLAQYMAQKGDCLYLQMSGFPVYFSEQLTEEPDFAAGGMGDLLFLLEQEDFARRTQELAKKFGRAYMLPPLAHFKDLLDCRPQDWERFLQRLREDCGFGIIIVEMGPIYEYFLDILEKADHVVFLHPEGLVGQVQKAVFRKYCETEHKSELASRIRYVRQPEEFLQDCHKWEKNPLEELVQDNQRMQFVAGIWEGRDAEEDEYIVEEFG